MVLTSGSRHLWDLKNWAMKIIKKKKIWVHQWYLKQTEQSTTLHLCLWKKPHFLSRAHLLWQAIHLWQYTMWPDRSGFRWFKSSLFTHMHTRHLEVVCLDSQIWAMSWFMASLATSEASSESKALQDSQLGDSSASHGHPNFLSWVLHLFYPAEVSVGKEQKKGAQIHQQGKNAVLPLCP